MNRGRSRLDIGEYGDIRVEVTAAGTFRAEARYRTGTASFAK